MTSRLRHLPLLLLSAVMLLGAFSCGNDEPNARRHDDREGPTPADTIHNNDTTGNDTTHHQGGDTTQYPGGDTTGTVYSVIINAARDYGYMGQTLQLTATTTPGGEAVTWRSTCTMVATVDGNGMVNFNNIIGDSTALIIASTAHASDTLCLHNRCWRVAAWNGTAWTSPAYLTAHPGDTLALTIVDSHAAPVNDENFNAAACQWTASSRNADVAALVKPVAQPSQDNGWTYRWAISHDTPAGAIISFMAQHSEAASAITCTIITR